MIGHWILSYESSDSQMEGGEKGWKIVVRKVVVKTVNEINLRFLIFILLQLQISFKGITDGRNS